MEKEMKDQFEVWVLPAWASNTIMETLSMDAESSMFEPELREEIKKAQLNVSWFTVPIATEEEPLQDFIKDKLDFFKEYHEQTQ
jgi:hypothetical protein